MASFLIAIFILFISHLTVDEDIPDTMKVGAWIFFGVVTLLYIIFGIIV